MYSPNGEEQGLEIGFVPTYIFFRNREEVGRIVENPMQSLEKDMLAILNDQSEQGSNSELCSTCSNRFGLNFMLLNLKA